jgi:hypothetical protein
MHVYIAIWRRAFHLHHLIPRQAIQIVRKAKSTVIPAGMPKSIVQAWQAMTRNSHYGVTNAPVVEWARRTYREP